MSNYQSYHTNVIIAAILNILPLSLREKIPRSTLHNFKQRDLDSLIGTELFGEIDYIKQFAQDKKAI